MLNKFRFTFYLSAIKHLDILHVLANNYKEKQASVPTATSEIFQFQLALNQLRTRCERRMREWKTSIIKIVLPRWSHALTGRFPRVSLTGENYIIDQQNTKNCNRILIDQMVCNIFDHQLTFFVCCCWWAVFLWRFTQRSRQWLWKMQEADCFRTVNKQQSSIYQFNLQRTLTEWTMINPA